MDSMKFAKGDCVVYGTNGICMIEDLKLMSFSTGMKKSLYYILRPELKPESVIFVPVDNEALVSKMRNVMTEDEVNSIILNMKDKELHWENDRRFRNENFHEILSNGVNEKMLLMIRCIYHKKEELTAMGRKLASSDMNTLKTAEKLVEEEFSYVLHIDNEEVEGYIKNMLEAV